MKEIRFLVALILLSGWSASGGSAPPQPEKKRAGPPVFEGEACEEVELVAREFLALERAGARWQGGNSGCLDGLRLKTWRKGRLEAPRDPALADPDYLLPPARRIDLKVRRLADDRILVKYSFVGRKKDAEVAVSDEFELLLQFGKTREVQGCARLIRPPRYLVMDENCAED